MKLFILKILIAMTGTLMLFSSAATAQAVSGKGTPASTPQSENGKIGIIVVDSVIKPNPANANTESGTGLRPDNPIIIEPGDNFKPSAKGHGQTPPAGATTIDQRNNIQPIR